MTDFVSIWRTLIILETCQLFYYRAGEPWGGFWFEIGRSCKYR
ncbi:hypothetical protein [uncultured Mobiluncus sp.]|nr:hypothetical protein [uncultured Mobiluncus sp.]